MGVYWMLANLTDKEILDFEGAKMSEMFGTLDTALLMKYMHNLSDRPKTMKFIADERGEWDECAKFKDITASVIVSLLSDENKRLSDWELQWCCRKMGERMDEIREYIPPHAFREQKKKFNLENRRKRTKEAAARRDKQ